MMEDREEFSVYWWDAENNQHREFSDLVSAERAVQAAHRLTQGPAAMLGMVNRVIITDGGDFCCFEWIKDKGITFK
jgi:hypothetical protein